MEDIIVPWLIFAALGVVFSIWEMLNPFRKMDQKAVLKKEILTGTSVVFLYDIILLFVFAALIPLIFTDSLMAAVASTGVLELPNWLRFAMMVLLFDFTFFCGHLFMHSKYGWRFHRFHHAPEHFFFLINLRGTIPHLLIARFALMTWAILLAIPTHYLLYFAVYAAIHGFWQHVNVVYNWMGYIEWFLTTPRSHCIHHFKAAKFQDKNFGALFSIWDHMFGYWADPRDIPTLKEEPIGINDKTSAVRVAIGID